MPSGSRRSQNLSASVGYVRSCVRQDLGTPGEQVRGLRRFRLPCAERLEVATADVASGSIGALILRRQPKVQVHVAPCLGVLRTMRWWVILGAVTVQHESSCSRCPAKRLNVYVKEPAKYLQLFSDVFWVLFPHLCPSKARA